MLPSESKVLKKFADSLRTELGAKLNAIHRAIQEQTSADHHKQETADNNWREVPGIIASNILGTDNDKATAEAHRKEQETQQNKIIFWARLAFFAAAAYGAVAFWQGCLMRQTYKEIQRQTKATEQSAYAACIGTKISQQLLLQTQIAEADAHGAAAAAVYQAMAATESERAEMQLILGKPEITDHDFGVGFSINNGGKTAAVRLHMQFRMVFIGNDEDPDFQYPPKQTVHGYNGRAEPGSSAALLGTNAHVIVLTPDGNNLVPTDTDRREYQSGNKDLVFFGRMTYGDIFGGNHWRNFCQPFHVFTAGLIKKAAHQKCALYNDGDTGSVLVKTIPAQTPTASLEEKDPCKKPDD
jgi:hypothetical protein